MEQQKTTESVSFSKKYFSENWVFYTMISYVCFVASNVVMAELSALGPIMILYFYTGSLVACTTYFIVYALKNKSGNDDDF